MTGFGQAHVDSKTQRLDVHARSVNGRFLEIRLNLPREFWSLEPRLRRHIEKNFHRGTIEIHVHRSSGGGIPRLILAEALAEQFLNQGQRLAKRLKISAELGLKDLLRLPEVVRLVGGVTRVSQAELRACERAVLTACQQLLVERSREGKSLGRELTRLVLKLKAGVSAMQKIHSGALQELMAKFRSKVRSQQPELSAERLAQEVAFLIEKADIREELVRLHEHLDSFSSMLNSSSPSGLGKKSEFYVQELLREVNTIGSKSQSAKLTAQVVETKMFVEQLREQVQNLE